MRKRSIANKKILVTGSRGFIGSNLIKKLQKKGASVIGASRSEHSKHLYKLDITSKEQVEDLIEKERISIIIHLAGESLVESGQKDPYQTFKTNVMGTLNMLEVTREKKLEKIIIASTSHVYGKNRLPHYEGYIPRPTRPYETSKTCTDLIAQSYADSFHLPVLISRMVNVYGPGDMNFDRLIPKTMRSIFKENKVKMWGGDAKRDYLYIDDATDAYIKLAEYDIRKIKNRIFNFGSGNIITVKDLVDKIISASKTQVEIEKIQAERSSELRSQYVSFKKAEKILDWRPRTNLDVGLVKTSKWYKDHFLRSTNL